MIGFASDMVGKHYSVLSRLLGKQPKSFSFGCLFHLGALCAAAAIKKLPVSLYVKPLRVLKHCTTRWLSLERCSKKLIQQWTALHCYFDEIVESEPGNERV